MANYVAYYRVSTDKQGRSGLGLEAQRREIERFLKPTDSLIAEFTDIESGSHFDRPQLQAALNFCRAQRAIKATLLIAKLDRLSRDMYSIVCLFNERDKHRVPIIIVDMPEANEFTLHIMAALAQHEARLTSQRTKAALAAAKARGTKLGGDRGYRPDRAKARERAKKRTHDAYLHIRERRGHGTTSLQTLAFSLNAMGFKAPRGGKWSPRQVSRVLEMWEAVD